MEFFKNYFHDIDFDENKGEVKVCCPFHNDTKPSATVNTDKNLFHCWVCGVGYNEEQFMANVKNITVSQAVKLLGEMGSHDNVDWDVTFKAELWADEELLSATRALGFSDEFIDKMNLGMARVQDVRTLAIPITFDNTIMDVRKYNLLRDSKIAKMTSERGAKAGWVFPYDIWKDSTEPTYLFEGEKDMMMARYLGLNAITLTGGASALPNEFVLQSFKGRDVVVCYDNDKAGRDGSDRLCQTLVKVCKTIGTVDISLLVKEEKEDFYDYIHKYDGNLFEFLAVPIIPYIETKHETVYTTLKSALHQNQIKKTLHSQVTVTSEFVEAYSVPTVIQATKMESTEGENDMAINDKKYWTLDNNNINEMLSLIEVDAKTKNVTQRAKELLSLNPKEKGIAISYRNEQFIYRTMITDKTTEDSSVTLDLYSLDKLKVGEQYDITYRLFAHPNKNQKIVAIAVEVTSLGDNSGFVVDKELLKPLQKEGTVEERLNHIFQSTKHYVADHMDYDIWLMSDLVFNSILDFKYGDVMRGALDVFMIGDTHVGKSETTSKLVDLYGFGHFLSLKTSTTVGLIGGSNKVDGSLCNTIGAIPRQNKKLVIMEEFSGARPDFIKTMTDIRSSNEVRLTRISGELKAPCKLRMLTISNPINDEGGSPRTISSFPNGVIPIMELIKSQEDVSRYDGFIICPKKENRFNPFATKLQGEPIKKECYEHKSQWVVTRRPDQVVFDNDVESYIWERAEYLNSMFECNIPIFGTTTSKKLARFCVALASLLTNTDENYEKVIVTKEIVDYMVNFLEKSYKSDGFKLDSVKEEWDSFNKYTPKELEILEDIYPSNATMFEFLAKQSRSNRANLQAVSGKDRDGFNVVFNQLVRLKVIRMSSDNIYPTEKFRKMFKVMRKLSGELVTKHSEKKEYDLERK